MKIPGAQILHPGVGQQLQFYTVRGHARYNDTSDNTGQNLRWIGYIQDNDWRYLHIKLL